MKRISISRRTWASSSQEESIQDSASFPVLGTTHISKARDKQSMKFVPRARGPGKRPGHASRLGAGQPSPHGRQPQPGVPRPPSVGRPPAPRNARQSRASGQAGIAQRATVLAACRGACGDVCGSRAELRSLPADAKPAGAAGRRASAATREPRIRHPRDTRRARGRGGFQRRAHGSRVAEHHRRAGRAESPSLWPAQGPR